MNNSENVCLPMTFTLISLNMLTCNNSNNNSLLHINYLLYFVKRNAALPAQIIQLKQKHEQKYFTE